MRRTGDDLRAFLERLLEIVADQAKHVRHIIHNGSSDALLVYKSPNLGLDVAGDPKMDYTETHQVIVKVGYAQGPEVAERLERNNIVCNYQATPEEEGFTASGALRMGVNEMTRFGFGKEEFAKLAHLIAECVKNGTDVRDEVARFRDEYTEMRYCFTDKEFEDLLNVFAKTTGI